MADLATTLPDYLEAGAVRRLDRSTQVVTQDNGFEVRNNRWASPLRVYEVNFMSSERDGAAYLAVLDLYDEAEGGLYSFNFTDWTDGTTVAVRFDSELQIQTPVAHLDQIVSVVLKEVRE